MGLGVTVTSAIFIAAILLTVIFLSITKRDLITDSLNAETSRKHQTALWQVALALSALVITAGIGYSWRHIELQHQATVSVSATSPLGDLSNFRKIAVDTLSFVQAGNLSAATTRIRDLEVAWDNAEAQLKPMNPSTWSSIDQSIDYVLRQLRAQNPDPATCKTSLESLISTLDALDHRK